MVTMENVMIQRNSIWKGPVFPASQLVGLTKIQSQQFHAFGELMPCVAVSIMS